MLALTDDGTSWGASFIIFQLLGEARGWVGELGIALCNVISQLMGTLGEASLVGGTALFDSISKLMGTLGEASLVGGTALFDSISKLMGTLGDASLVGGTALYNIISQLLSTLGESSWAAVMALYQITLVGCSLLAGLFISVSLACATVFVQVLHLVTIATCLTLSELALRLPWLTVVGYGLLCLRFEGGQGSWV
jgi:hypothetical protein